MYSARSYMVASLLERLIVARRMALVHGTHLSCLCGDSASRVRSYLVEWSLERVIVARRMALVAGDGMHFSCFCRDF